jgi:AAA15 family ATPase/GTPase
MIAEFTVKNFSSFRQEQKLNFVATSDDYMSDEYCYKVNDDVRLLKMGIVYGANASGKSNILSALSFFKYIMLKVPADKTKNIGFDPFLLDNESRNEKSGMSMVFYLNGERYALDISFDKKRIYEETLTVYLSTRPTLLYKREYNSNTESAEIKFGSESKISKNGQVAISGNTINNCSVMAAFGKSNLEASRLNAVYEFFSHEMRYTLNPRDFLMSYAKDYIDEDTDGKIKRFVKMLLKASDFNINDFSLKKTEMPITPELEKMIMASTAPERIKNDAIKKGSITNTEFLFKHETDNGLFDLSEEDESDGTLRFMGMAVLLYNLLKKKRFIPIDEFESSLHYELLSYLIRLFLANSENTSQLFFTTHDINLLNEDFIRQDAVWFTDKNSCGETILERLSSMKLRKTLSPYNAYMQGKLVKLPFLGSTYLNLKEIEDE